jgi:tryptophan synthase alpha chain
MTNRIASTISGLKQDGKKALIPYITPEYPFKGMTLPLLKRLEQSGADMIEIGIPFSDPLADGPTIQHSSEVALKNGATIRVILQSVIQFRTSSNTPIILMGYFNPILKFGISEFTKAARDAGVDGVIVADLPLEEATELIEESQKVGLSNVFLIAPTSPDERIKKIDQVSTDFSYCVSVSGVTGAREGFGTNGSVDHFLQRVSRVAQKPFVVGFGISNAEHVQRVWQYANGAVVGSALVEKIGGGTNPDDVLKIAGDFLSSLRPHE